MSGQKPATHADGGYYGYGYGGVGSGSRGLPIGATATALFTTGQASIAVPTWLIAQVV